MSPLKPHPNPTQTNVLAAWPWAGKIYLSPIQAGLINSSFAVSGEKGGQPYAILQRLNTDIFTPEVNIDIAAITQRLEARGMLTPKLMATKRREPFHTDELGQVWRCMTWVGQKTLDRFTSTREVMSAARLVAQFHIALQDMNWRF